MISDVIFSSYFIDSENRITVKPTGDFIKLFLTTSEGRAETELHNLVIANDDVIKEAQPIPNDKNDDLQLNIAFIMLDSVSAAGFRRVMPKSLDFLNNQKHTIFFKGWYSSFTSIS